MALSRGVKIVLGCAAVLVLVVGGTIVALVGAAWWGVNKAKEKVHQMENDQKRVDANLERANANAFSEPVDGVIAEDRLMRFIAVRKHVYDIYAPHKATLEAHASDQAPDLGTLARFPGILMDLRAAKAEGLAQEGMSEDEFRWLVGAVYRDLALLGSHGGPSVSEAMRTAGGQALEQAENAARAAEADPSVPLDAKRRLREAAQQMRDANASTSDTARTLDVPPANKALFEKHKDEIVKYTMGGLELLSL